MKKTILIASILFSSLMLTSCWSRMGRLNIVSTRNMDSKTDYVLLSKDVRGKAKSKKQDPIEIAIDKAVKQYPTGEFMKNVVIEVNASGKKIRVVGDVWGYAPTTAPSSGEIVNKNVTKSVNAKVEFKIGDSVTYKTMLGVGKLVEGKIIGVNQNTAVVQLPDGSKSEIKYEKLTKIER